jgi:hypothetical protein
VLRRDAPFLRVSKEFFRIRNQKDQAEGYDDCANECRDGPSEADYEEVLAGQGPDLAQ